MAIQRQPVPMLRASGVIPIFHLYNYVAETGKTLLLPRKQIYIHT